MALTVTLYSFAKKLNSTAQPTTDGIQYDCILKNDTTITMPIIKLNLSMDSNPTQYNYAYIPAFKRYYYIDNWTYSERLWNAQMRVDVLASQHDEIGEMTAYIKRSSAEYTPEIVDSFYPVMSVTGRARTENITTYGFVSRIEDGFFMVGIIGDRPGSFGGVQYYAMTTSQFSAFASMLLSGIEWAAIDPEEISENLQKALINPYQYIVSARWFPFSMTGISGTPVDNINFGYWTVAANARLVQDINPVVRTFSFAAPVHPQSTRGTWLNLSPYTKRAIYITGYGWHEVTQLTGDSATILVYADIDLFSGMGQFYTNESSASATGAYSDMVTVKIGVDVPLSQISMSTQLDTTGLVVGALSQAPSIIGSLFGKNDYDIAGGIGSIANSAFPPVVSTNGAQDSPYLYEIEPYMVSIFTFIGPEDNEHFGRPLCDNRQINTIPGYVMVEHGDYSSDSLTSGEITEINTLLESGFFYE